MASHGPLLIQAGRVWQMENCDPERGKWHGMLCSFSLNKHPHGAWSLLLKLLSFPTETAIVRFFWWFHSEFDVLLVSYLCGSSSSCGGMSLNRTAFEDLWRQ